MKFNQAIQLISMGVIGVTANAHPKLKPGQLPDPLLPKNIRTQKEADVCPNEMTALQSCLVALPDPEGCIDCFLAEDEEYFKTDPSPTCSEYAEFCCPAWNGGCPACGSCGGEIEEYTFCFYECGTAECGTLPPTLPPSGCSEALAAAVVACQSCPN